MIQKSNSNLSFARGIKITSPVKFNEYAEKIGKNFSVNSPWTEREILRAESAYTTRIYDCTAGGITDGKDVVMFHICPDYVDPKDFGRIEKVLLKKLDINNPDLKGFLIGSCDFFGKSRELFKHFEDFMKANKIKYSALKNHFKCEGYSNLLYDSNEKQWVVSHAGIEERVLESVKNPDEIVRKLYKNIFIEDSDNLIV